ncbi:polysaccharide lyase family 8 super-sandwich domain-containing protein [Crossiella sp. CA-258035]|uniref:polysaccharide lyase family 8 super-sandwich domain-containing protein n=1 Tax=Crossiella sp. CA-258035 TaxID=2981138 RepID=UPI0024BCB956|nr:polysaccharide lyase family 8 super-sandwich domain-containing protein [Crossiella sp. CA-258035]WHT22798.1 polysaccharide lyase family 8 super-sandwich domain-containing protein [Crossiella sp. CA-258035]
MSFPLSRRQLLLATGALAAVPLGAASTATEFDTLRQRWANALTGGAINPADPVFRTALSTLDNQARRHRDTMTGSLWPDLPLGSSSANLTASFTRLRLMALAHATPGTSVTGDPQLAAQIVNGMSVLGGTYRAGQRQYGNWWDWEIGSPQALLDLCVLLAVPATQLAAHLAAVDHFVPTPYRMMPARKVSTGANRADLALVVALRGILGGKAEALAVARDSLSDLFPYTRTGDGMYADGSFVQHDTVPYTGTYGHVILNRLAQLFLLLAGSSWDVTDPLRANVHASVPAAYAPMVFRGRVFDFVRGRAISRTGERDADDGLYFAWDLLLLANSGHPELRSLAKTWLLANTARPVSAHGTVAQIALAAPVLADASIPVRPEPVGHQQFPSMDRVVHRGPGWALAIALNSARMNRFESMNGENLRGWHTTEGMTYLYTTARPGDFTDEFWPTVDPYRLPGTTISATRLADGAGAASLPSTTWAGGASLSGKHGAVGLDLQAHQNTVTAKKSWFCLGEVVLALGAGITGVDRVETVLENRNGAPELTTGGPPERTGWLAIDGVGGIVFPTPTAVHTLREQRTGRWRDISTTGPATAITRPYLTLWLDHGVNPTGASYAYLLLPGASADTTKAYAASPEARVLANTAAVQAVTDRRTGITAANFFTAGTAAGITVDGPASVLAQDQGGALTLAVADPTRAAATRLVELARNGFRLAEPAPGCTLLSSAPTVKLLVETGGTLGATRTIRLTRGTQPARRAEFRTAEADTYVRDGAHANTNYDNESSLVIKRVASGAGYTRQALLRFALPSGRIDRAVLWVKGRVEDSGGTQTGVRAYGISPDWDPATVTWNTRPALGPAAGTATACTATDWLAFDVTALVSGGKLAVALYQDEPGLAVVTNGPATLQVVLGNQLDLG